MPNEIVLWDTGPLVALLDRRDQSHAACTAALEHIGRSMTTEAVLTEAHFLLRRVPEAPVRLLELLLGWQVEVFEADLATRLRQAELMTKYANVPMDYADATLVAAAEVLDARSVFTLDRDFLIYRLYDRQPFTAIP